jgi:pyruvate,water dikinase
VREEFPLAWERAEDAVLAWRHDEEHWPGPLSPQVFAIAGEPVARALTAAARAYELPVTEFSVRRVNTYRYQSSQPAASDSDERRARSRQKLRKTMGHLDRTWEESWLPEVRRHLAFWEGFDLAGAPLAELGRHYEETLARVDRVWEIHFLLAAPMRAAVRAFARLHRELFGGSTLDALALLTGLNNATRRGGRALWALSRLARSTPEVGAVLPHGREAMPALAVSAGGRAFLKELRRYLEEFGRRGDDLDLQRLSWIEDPTPVLENLRALIDEPDRDLAREELEAITARELALGESRRLLEGYPEPVREEFECLLAAARQATVLSEDHNLWIDGRCLHRVRMVIIELGRRLAGAGAVERPDDVFYLTAGDLHGAAPHFPSGWRELVACRRAELERLRSIVPPPVIGAPPATQGRRVATAGGQGARALRGEPSSPGRARGVARVLASPSEACRLGRGDILVTAAPSSSWAPLFWTAGAVVAETGCVLSHGAVIARECGIPAVFGVASATSAILDGELVEVDGADGTVSRLSG